MNREEKEQKKRKKRQEGANLLPLMVIEIIIIVALAAVIVLGLLYLKGVRLPFLSDNTRTEVQTDQNTTETAATTDDSNSKFKFIKNKEVQTHEYSTYIFFGDSRIEGMRDVCAQANEQYICEVGEGYYWMLDHIEEVSEIIWNDSDPALVLEFGINDMQNIDLYIAKANELAASYSCPVFYMTVNPVDEEMEAQMGYDKTNAEIDDFNEQLKAGLSDSITVIDTNSYLKQEGYETIDGIHYSDETYQVIHDYVKDAVQSH